MIDSRSDLIVENAGEGVDTVWTPFDFSLDGSVVENVKTFAAQTTAVTLTGSSWGNQISGGAGGDRLLGLAGDDQLSGLAGNDFIDGGLGLDTALFAINRRSTVINHGASGWTVNSSAEGSDLLVNVERLDFIDVNVALDLSDHAGIVAKTLGVTFGKTAVANKPLVGIALALVDGGWSYQTLMEAASNASLGATHTREAFVDLLYRNLVGAPAPAADRAYLVSLIANGTFTEATLGVAAAELDIDKSNVDLVGLSQSGLDYIPWAG